MGLLSVIVAAIAGFAVGAAWYMSMSKSWVEASGIPVDEAGKPKGNGGAMPFVIGFICMILVAGMMRHMLASSGIEGPFKSLVSGLGVGAFFITPWVAMNYAYGMRKPKLTLIDGAYSIVGPGVIGLVLGFF